MQTAHDRELDHLADLWRLYGPRLRRVLRERQVGSAAMVVVQHVRTQEPSQRTLVHHDHVIDQLSAQCSDHAFDVWILPRGESGDDDFLDAQILDAMPKDRTMDAVPVA